MKRLFTIAAALIAAVTVSAQTSMNAVIPCCRHAITYTQPEKTETAGQTAAKVIGAVLEAKLGSSTVSTDHPEYADAVADAIAGAVGNAYRIEVIDGEFIPDWLDEGEPALYLEGSIASIRTRDRIKEVTSSDGKKHDEREYTATINATVNILNAHSGAIEKTINISASSWSESWWASSDKALAYAINEMSSYITRSVDRAFPLYATIIEGNKAKKDKQKDVYIDLGSDMGMQTGTNFVVYEQKTIAGKEARKEIGHLRVKEVLGPELSLCKVVRGGAAIKSRLDGNDTLIIESDI